MRIGRRARRRWIGLLVLPCVVAAGCGGSKEPELPGPPVGHAVLPDLSPAPPTDLRTRKVDGKWRIQFSSVLVNVGDGAFVLRASRGTDGAWRVVQEIPHSTSGAESVRVAAHLVWGGDGHEHWHVARVATVRLVGLGADGRPVAGDEGRVDTKIGFCFFDHSRGPGTGPEKAQYTRHDCGHRDDDFVRMGLSPGWRDVYEWVLPGQNIDISGLSDGMYRLWADVDESGWFREATRDNNRSWVDLRLSTTPDGVRTALIVRVGPRPA